MVTEIAIRDRLQPSLPARLNAPMAFTACSNPVLSCSVPESGSGLRLSMKKHLLTVCLAMNFISLGAWAQHAEPTATQAVFVGQQLRLVDDQGRCTLVKPDQTRMRLDMEWPCSFSLDKPQRLRVETFNDIPIFAVWRSEHMPAPSRDCLSKMQAIRQINGALEAGAASNYASCGSGGDQKMYVGPFTW